jgi:hypothetical protein
MTTRIWITIAFIILMTALGIGTPAQRVPAPINLAEVFR